ncbi:ribokinase [Clostridium sp. D2Q-14]|uniref:ribokinase n=1 Tax=Anaeromonas gelatinilytica TaxID=2683194 RepID=UPI00193BC729|nr:ribokinase [Anaeromonas gelatinilytica]MBS4536769.1 ribokinase [Anaeromonas gelatinilytica]
MKKVLIIGSLNMDMIVSVDSIPQIGETIISNSVEKYSGGKGGNQAVACARFNADTYMLASIGNDQNGRKLKEDLEREGIDTTGIKVHEYNKTGMAWITVDNEGNNSIVVIPGTNGDFTKEFIDENEKIIGQADIILLQMEIPVDVVEYAIDKGRENDAFIILNPAPARVLSEKLLSKIDVITPNENELATLTKSSDLSTNSEKAKYLIDLGVKNVICTLGESGALFINSEEELYFPPYPVNAIDTTGAGDCFNGVLAAEISKGRDMKQAIENAILASAVSVTRRGAQPSMPVRQDIMNKI